MSNKVGMVRVSQIGSCGRDNEHLPTNRDEDDNYYLAMVSGRSGGQVWNSGTKMVMVLVGFTA